MFFCKVVFWIVKKKDFNIIWCFSRNLFVDEKSMSLSFDHQQQHHHNHQQQQQQQQQQQPIEKAKLAVVEKPTVKDAIEKYNQLITR